MLNLEFQKTKEQQPVWIEIRLIRKWPESIDLASPLISGTDTKF